MTRPAQGSARGAAKNAAPSAGAPLNGSRASVVDLRTHSRTPGQRHGDGQMSRRRLVGINAFWFGNGAHWQPIFVALIPEGAKLVAGRDAADDLVGRATAAGGLFALLVPLLVGWLSDRTRSRWGRRRPWMVAGTAVNVVGLLLLGAAWSPGALIAFVLLVQCGNNIAGAAYSGVIPDVVPDPQRGTASGLLGTMNQVGTVVGVLLIGVVFAVFGSSRAAVAVGYAAVAGILVASLVVSCIAVQEPVLAALKRTQRRRALSPTAVICGVAFVLTVAGTTALLVAPLGEVLPLVVATTVVAAGVTIAGGWRLPTIRAQLSSFADHDFRWVIVTRTVMQLGIFSIVPFIDSYFEHAVGSSNPGAASSAWLLVVILGGVGPALVGGSLSDRIGRRKLFVYVSGAIQAVAASVVLLTLITNTVGLYAVGLLFGVGYGMYYAVDWALACDVLPDRSEATGRDMAWFHVAFTLPQVVAPTIAAQVLDRLNATGGSFAGIPTGNNFGFRVVFGSAALWFLLGTVLVRRIRGVK